jgi:GT2 family glycosyltransferase
MDLSIIIVNWNSTDFIAQCVSSILSFVENLQFEIIVVDNASSDDSYLLLPRRFEKVRLICSPENIGFARANNLGFENSSGKYVLFLNPDTKVINAAINFMYSFLQSSPEAGAVGCRLLNADLSVQTSCIQRFPTILNQLTDIEWLRLRYPKLRFWGIYPLFAEEQNVLAEVEVICGACIMIRREVFQGIGLFSSEYFMYGEDADLCYKIREAGRKLIYIGAGTIVHYGKQSSTRRKEDSFETVVMRESIFQLLRKTRGRFYSHMYRIAMSLMAAFRLILVGPLLVLSRRANSRESWRISFKKWWKILRWSVGLESSTARVGSSFKHVVLPAKN